METINAECRCAELEDDFLTALQRGDAPEIEEFVALHPEHAERMRQSLRRVAAIQNAVARRSLLPTSESSQPPRLTVPGYEVLGELGRGGMGIVYEARELGLDRIVALKMIRGAVNLGDESRSRFQREAKAVAKLQHPNIVQIYQIGEHDGQPFISLELVEGGNLDRLVAHQPQPARDVVTFGSPSVTLCIKMFAGFKSRWMMPRSWAECTARARVSIHLVEAAHRGRRSPTTHARDPL